MTTPRQLLDQLERAEREATGPPAQVRAQIWDQLEARLDSGAQPPELDDAPLLHAPARGTKALKLLGVLTLVGVVTGLGWVASSRRSAPAEDTGVPALVDVSASTPASAEPEAPRAAPPTPGEDLFANQGAAEPTRPEPGAEADANAGADLDAGTDEAQRSKPANAKPRGATSDASRSANTEATSAAPAKTLADELALMQALSTALKRGDLTRARSLVAEHERDFPEGQFIEERAAAKARALCQTGGARIEAGREAAERFATRWPSSIHLAAVDADCGTEKKD
ncbi:hypothetical protein G6O69_13820 [Pseudenhygromyxa sp. WMMC2535]|uniref:hypothetical protein n=1 Tax=Pseudenhygromyxa sp. WMMC2535 TaxID=2712867 RepID=UPI00155241E5|nr:hypothetical protein [Pseudenhygromyxa sp. WMMC2535]NVB38915.1 hypothetical protein [Pseudenhygromyxa sp. WMMC2535]